MIDLARAGSARSGSPRLEEAHAWPQLAEGVEDVVERAPSMLAAVLVGGRDDAGAGRWRGLPWAPPAVPAALPPGVEAALRLEISAGVARLIVG